MPHAWSKKKNWISSKIFFLLGAIFANNTTFLQTKKRDLPKSEYEALKQYKIMSKDATCQTHQSRSTSVSVDGGMSDNPRPVLYGSGYEAFLPRAVDQPRDRPVRIVGKHCESGDVLVREAFVPDDIAVGDLLATPVTGAYGHSLGSNYNKVLRPAVVFVADGEARLVVRRETFDDLLRTDLG